MNTVYVCTVTKGGNVAYTFVCYDNKEHASFLAGSVMDSLCDYHGGDDWYYEVSPAPYVGSMTPDIHIVREALSKVVI